jgi:hypothetical protein
VADKDYTFGLAINARAPDNRFDYRLSARAKAVIHLETGESVQYIDRQQVRACPVRDLSASGLRLWSACSLPVGAFLPAVIHLVEGQPDYHLMLEIVWCKPEQADLADASVPPTGYLAGCRVLESGGTEAVEWLEAIAMAMLKA